MYLGMSSLRVKRSVAMHDVMVQSAFKRAPSSRNPSISSGLPQSQVEDWDGVKAEDKTLVHQVTTRITCMPTVVNLNCYKTFTCDFCSVVLHFMCNWTMTHQQAGPHQISVHTA